MDFISFDYRITSVAIFNDEILLFPYPYYNKGKEIRNCKSK